MRATPSPKAAKKPSTESVGETTRPKKIDEIASAEQNGKGELTLYVPMS